MSIELWNLLSLLISSFALFIVFFLIRKEDYYRSDNKSSDFASITSVTVLKNRIDDLELRLMEREERIKELRKEIEEIKKERDARIEYLNNTIDSLRERIAFLENLLYRTNSLTYSSREKIKNADNPVLLITADNLIQKADEIALNKARIVYRRIANATLDKIKNELRRRRMEGKMYRFIVFSSHMSDAGIALYGGEVADSYWLNAHLTYDIDLVILNGCESTTIADNLVGVVGAVISISEKIMNDDAASFLTAFWREFSDGLSLREAFNKSKEMNPSISSFVDLQVDGKKDFYFSGD